MFDTLISAGQLKPLIDSTSDYCIVDCRFNLADTGEGRRAWQAGHLPGAFYAHLDDDLSGRLIAGQTGRHPLPDRSTFLQTLASFGIGPDTQIIAYDSSGGAIAARLWWLCRWIGHRACAVLDGGIQAWTDALVTDRPVAKPADPLPDNPPLLDALTTQDIQTNGSLLLIDARERARYLGEVEPIDPVAGHIPGAVCLPFPENLDSNGLFLDRPALARRYQPFSGNGKTPVMYCGSGVTAAHNVLAMTHAGLPTPALYAESWSGWITDPERPVATGERNA
ncbi:MAG: sulfurtransferase [Gammaproteobacteria bacterium]|nr:sulfurtransferase [Gammaproteobacteria bacterium]